MTNVSTNCMMTIMPTCTRYGCRKEAVRKFCSESCKIAHHNAQRDRTNSEKKKCLACNKSFIGRPNKITCSDSCRQQLFRTRKVKVKVPKYARRLSGAGVEIDPNTNKLSVVAKKVAKKKAPAPRKKKAS